MAAVIAAACTLVYGYVLGGWFTPKLTLEDHRSLVVPSFEVTIPDTANLVPVAILVPGCLGPHTQHRNWAEWLTSEGWATVIVDSFTPRGMLGVEEIEPVCEGGRPWGFERAADVVAATTYIKEQPAIDPSKVALFGWSNGGWAVMDALSFGPTSRPANLTDTCLKTRRPFGQIAKVLRAGLPTQILDRA
ncbi:prolyl oligopeptidase family serine peptidase [Yoonia sp. SS1-5]|uniref:Dienelactone hydrolase family protein n=1 Tax=Yoonia rhodophyticola TaxID=3137370 RepID=A0AAN0MLN0_9RHOB